MGGAGLRRSKKRREIRERNLTWWDIETKNSGWIWGSSKFGCWGEYFGIIQDLIFEDDQIAICCD